jgi:hypothetical protein
LLTYEAQTQVEHAEGNIFSFAVERPAKENVSVCTHQQLIDGVILWITDKPRRSGNFCFRPLSGKQKGKINPQRSQRPRLPRLSESNSGQARLLRLSVSRWRAGPPA